MFGDVVDDDDKVVVTAAGGAVGAATSVMALSVEGYMTIDHASPSRRWSMRRSLSDNVFHQYILVAENPAVVVPTGFVKER